MLLVRIESDHFPLVLDTNPVKWGPSPFRFENVWFIHKEFLGNAKKWWAECENRGWEGFKFMKKLEFLKHKLKTWNKEVFRDVSIEKGKILDRIKKIDEEETRGDIGVDLIRVRRELRKKFGDLVLKEEISWNQKAKMKGVIEWDGNSKLFHRIVNQKKTNKMIYKLEKEDGSVVDSEGDIITEIVEYFKKLYSKKKIERA